MTGSWRSSARPERRYWFHLHTIHSHGTSTAREYLDAALELKVERLVFLEHIRRAPSYDPEAFAREIRAEAEGARLAASVGFEAKILPGGSLDIPDGLLESADVIGIAEHAYTGDASTLAADFARLVADLTTAHPRQTFVWVHPGAWLSRSGLPTASVEYEAMLKAALDAGVWVERNLKYDLVPFAAFRALPAAARVVGLDAHSVEDALTRWSVQWSEAEDLGQLDT